MLFICLPWMQVSASENTEFVGALDGLAQSSISKRAAAIEQIAATDDPRRVELFELLIAGELYYRKSDKLLGRLLEKGDEYSVITLLDSEELAVDNKRDWKKIIINNKMRGDLRTKMATLSLDDESPKVRLSAVEQILGDMDTSLKPALSSRLEKESDDDVKAALKQAIAALTLKSGDTDDKLPLVAEVSTSLNSGIRQLLQDLAANDSDAAVKKAASDALVSIEERIAYYGKIETLFFGLSLGSVLVLAAIGLAITFGVMGVINMAHGELIMLGAYTTYVVQLWLPELINYSVLIAIPLAFLVSGSVGILIERGVIRHLYGRPLETLLATFGISLILQQVVRSIFSPLNRAVEAPSWMSGVWQVNEALALTWNRLYIILFSLMVFALLFFILKKTRLGLMVRAVSQNRSMARAMGVRSSWVDAMTFGLGSGIAGVAGVALSQLTNVGPNLGQSYIIDSFMVVVFGGVGNLWGTLVAGLGLGVVNKILEPWSGAVLAKILVLIFIILFIQKRPRGMFPQKGRAADN
jgi:urea transport system permease protein